MTTPSAPTGDHGGLKGAVEAALRDPANQWWHTGGTPCIPRRVILELLAAHPEPEPAQDGEVAAVLAVLAEHALKPTLGDFVECECGWAKRRGEGTGDLYRAHVAAVLVAAGVTR